MLLFETKSVDLGPVQIEPEPDPFPLLRLKYAVPAQRMTRAGLTDWIRNGNCPALTVNETDSHGTGNIGRHEDLPFKTQRNSRKSGGPFHVLLYITGPAVLPQRCQGETPFSPVKKVPVGCPIIDPDLIIHKDRCCGK